VDGKSIWKVLSKEASGSVGGVKLQLVCEVADVCMCDEEDRYECRRLIASSRVSRSPFVVG
jgi:hypothetical protein